jgi:intron-binding protein aquarius
MNLPFCVGLVTLYRHLTFVTAPTAGMGEQELDTGEDFSRVGRVNAMLARRLELLAQVERMARQLGVTEDVAYTCETAAHFWLMHVVSRCAPIAPAMHGPGLLGSLRHAACMPASCGLAQNLRPVFVGAWRAV